MLILGGTGFIGWHAAHEFLRRVWHVTAVALPPLLAPDLFPPEVRVELADFRTISDDAFAALLQGHDASVFAIGADDRTTPKAPASPFFKQANVDSTVRFIRLCRRAGVTGVVLLGSYFSHFARFWPELELARHHPYIRSRVEQEDAATAEAGSDITLAILELPYIFGAMPGRTPLWKPLVDYVRSAPLIIYPRGGTNCISVQYVSEAIAGAVGKSGRFLVGDENLAWFGRQGAQVLEYWLDESRFSDWNRAKTVEIPWSDAVFHDDLATYAQRGICHVTTFAAWLDGDYAKRWGVAPVRAYGAGLNRWKWVDGKPMEVT